MSCGDRGTSGFLGLALRRSSGGRAGAIEIGQTIKQRKLTQQVAAKLMGIDQPRPPHVLIGRLAGYSTERLMGFLTALGRDIEIVVRPAPRRRRQGRLRVVAA